MAMKSTGLMYAEQQQWQKKRKKKKMMTDKNDGKGKEVLKRKDKFIPVLN
jgi:hypothetical protein